jgi:thymidylate synthase
MKVHSAPEFLQFTAIDLLTRGSDLSVRGKNIKELMGFSCEWSNPLLRWQISKERKYNVFSTCAELLWILSGRNDIQFLLPFLPRAADFSDDGKTWRAGYGQRIFRYGSSSSNQFLNTYFALKKDIYSRQAVISLWDPETDSNPSWKDRPCSNHLQFLFRDGRLHLFFLIRSNDLIWGASSINLPEFSILLELMALSLGVPVGSLWYRANSMHCYDIHFDRLSKISQELLDCSFQEQTQIGSQLSERFSDYLAVSNQFSGEDFLTRVYRCCHSMTHLIETHCYEFPEDFESIPPCIRDLYFTLRFYLFGYSKDLESISDLLLLYSIRNSWKPSK